MCIYSHVSAISRSRQVLILLTLASAIDSSKRFPQGVGEAEGGEEGEKAGKSVHGPAGRCCGQIFRAKFRSALTASEQ